MSLKSSGSITCKFSSNLKLTTEENVDSALCLAKQIAIVQRRNGCKTDHTGCFAHVIFSTKEGLSLTINEQSKRSDILRQIKRLYRHNVTAVA